MRASWLPATLVLLVACDPAPAGSTGAAPTATVSAPVAASSAPRPAAPRYEDAKLHVPADFEAEAEAAITKDNYKDALAELHEEITGEARDEDDEAAPSAKPAPAPSATLAPAPGGTAEP